MVTDTEVIEVSGARFTCAFDTLRQTMRDLFYRLEAAGLKPTHARAGHRALIGYEGLCFGNDQPVTTFKGIPVTLASNIWDNRIEFWCGDRLVGAITDIS